MLPPLIGGHRLVLVQDRTHRCHCNSDAVKVTGKRVIGAADRSPLGSRLTFQGWQTPGAWLYDAWWTRLDRETGGVL